jgi:hypothetical protein
MPKQGSNGRKYKAAMYSAGEEPKVLLEQAIRLVQLAQERIKTPTPSRKRK